MGWTILKQQPRVIICVDALVNIILFLADGNEVVQDKQVEQALSECVPVLEAI